MAKAGNPPWLGQYFNGWFHKMEEVVQILNTRQGPRLIYLTL
jgi:hypothetical protein